MLETRLGTFLLGILLLSCGPLLTWIYIKATIVKVAEYHTLSTEWFIALLFGVIFTGFFISIAVSGAWIVRVSVRWHE